jgi:hypothetical protein
LYQTARLHRLAESIPWNQFLGFLKRAQKRVLTKKAGSSSFAFTVEACVAGLNKNTSMNNFTYSLYRKKKKKKGWDMWQAETGRHGKLAEA